MLLAAGVAVGCGLNPRSEDPSANAVTAGADGGGFGGMSTSMGTGGTNSTGGSGGSPNFSVDSGSTGGESADGGADGGVPVDGGDAGVDVDGGALDASGISDSGEAG